MSKSSDSKTEKTRHIHIRVPVQEIAHFHDESQEGSDWANILDPFAVDNLTHAENGSWYQTLFPHETITFKISESPNQGSLDPDLTIEFIRFNPLGEVNYRTQSPINAWHQLIDPKTKGSVGELGSFYLEAPDYTLHSSNYVNDFSPNLTYTILFSFRDVTGTRRYCTIDPLLKTSSEHTHKDK